MADTYFRRSKSNPHDNMMHVLKMGALVLLGLLVVWPSIERLGERLFMPVVPISATVELKYVDGEVLIDYEPLPIWPVRNTQWVGQLRTPQGKPLQTAVAPRRYTYTPGKRLAKMWTWRGWWDDPTPVAEPAEQAVPSQPFVLCVSYNGFGAHGDTYFDTPFSCSEPFDDHLRGAGQ